MEYDLSRVRDDSLESGFQGMALYLSERLKDFSSPYDTRYRSDFDRKCQTTEWECPASPLKVVCEAMSRQASPFPADSNCCWQKEFFKLCRV